LENIPRLFYVYLAYAIIAGLQINAVDKTRSRAENGRGGGVGRAVASWIAKAHGGSLSLERADQIGSVFAVRRLAIYKSRFQAKISPRLSSIHLRFCKLPSLLKRVAQPVQVAPVFTDNSLLGSAQPFGAR
jgi:hypothetical protein